MMKIVIDDQEFDVSPIVRDPDVVDLIEERVRMVPNFLPKEQSLWSVVSQPGSAWFTVDTAGLVGAINIRQGYFGEAHITFWDGKLSEERAKICREVGKMVMESSGLHFLLTYIPEDRLRVLEFASAVGFVPVERSNGVVAMAFMRKENLNGN